LSEEEKHNLLDSFPGRDEGNKKRINLFRLYDQKYNMLMQKMYTKVDCYENDGKDDPVDAAGYYGQFYRAKRDLQNINEAEMIKVMAGNNKIIEIWRSIK